MYSLGICFLTMYPLYRYFFRKFEAEHLLGVARLYMRFGDQRLQPQRKLAELVVFQTVVVQ